MATKESKPDKLVVRDALVLDPSKVDVELWTAIAYSAALEYDQEPSPDAIEEDGEGALEDFSSELTLQTIARRFGITATEALGILANPKFSQFFHNMQMAIARSDFDRHAMRRMMRIVRYGGPKDAIAAASKLARWLGYERDAAAVNLSLNFEAALRASPEEEGKVQLFLIQSFFHLRRVSGLIILILSLIDKCLSM